MSTFPNSSDILQWNGPHRIQTTVGNDYRVQTTAVIDWSEYWHKVDWDEVTRPKRFNILDGRVNDDCPHCNGTGKMDGAGG